MFSFKIKELMEKNKMLKYKQLFLLSWMIASSILLVPISTSKSTDYGTYTIDGTWMEIASDADGDDWLCQMWENCGKAEIDFVGPGGTTADVLDVEEPWQNSLSESDWEDRQYVFDKGIQYELRLRDWDFGGVFESLVEVKIKVQSHFQGTINIDMSDSVSFQNWHSVYKDSILVVQYYIQFRRCYDVNCNGFKIDMIRN